METNQLTLLVIDENPGLHSTDWTAVFADWVRLTPRTTLVVEQASWKDVSLTSYTSSDNVVADLAPSSHPVSDRQKKTRTITPSFILLRNMCYALHPWDYRNTLYGLMHAGIPSVNSLQATYMCLEKPVVHGALREIQRRLGPDRFPLIEQNYHSAFNQVGFTPRFPIVVKISHVHAGFGKVLVRDSKQLEDLKSVIALHGDYCVAEPFEDADYDIRIQKIGSHYRAFKRVSINDMWKTNMGFSEMEQMEMTERYKLWVDECAKLFGGIDVLALDAIHTRDGKEYILELNDTPGLLTDCRDKDLTHIRELVLEKVKRLALTRQARDDARAKTSRAGDAKESKGV